MSADPFGTADLRARALETWTRSPVRLREDANAEDDSALGSYVDRLVVELAQNAGDAARRAGVPGRLRLVIADGVLYAANTGAPLDPAGVEALSHRRVSTKGDGDAGRFGVGFSAVLAVTDFPSLWTAAGGVEWSRDRTARTLAAVPELAEQLDRRSGAVPVMRLPWPVEEGDDIVMRLLDEGAATVVRLPLRDARAAKRANALLDAADPLLLLFWPDLDDVTIEVDGGARRTTSRVADDGAVELVVDGQASRWRLHRAQGQLSDDALAELSVEDRERASWSVTWAVPLDGEQPVPHTGDRRLRAPQPVDEEVGFPAVLCATLPLDSGRRHVRADTAAGRHVVRQAARAYADLLAEAAPGPWLVDLLPTPSSSGSVDLALRVELADLLPAARFLASAADPAVRLRPDEALALDVGPASAGVTTLLAEHLPRLIHPDSVRGARRLAALTGLGTRVGETADVVDWLGAVDAPPRWWGEILVALVSASDLDALRALPLPCADGTTAVGLRDLVLPAESDLTAALDALGLAPRTVHPDLVAVKGAADALRRLGVGPADPAALLDDPRVRAAIDLGDDGDVDPAALADAVLALLAIAPELAVDRRWLAEVLLPDRDGELRPAGELLLPTAYGGRLAALVDPDGPLVEVADDLVERHGVDAVTAAGVLSTFATLEEDDVVVGAGALEGYLDRADDWLGDVADQLPDGDSPWVLDQVRGVRDLELVRPDASAWAGALDELGRVHLTAVTGPVIALRDGARALREPYTAWWLRGSPCVPAADGSLHRPGDVAAGDAESLLLRLLPVAAPLSDDAGRLLAYLGAVGSFDAASAEQVALLIDAVGRPDAGLDAADVRTVYAALLRRSRSVPMPADAAEQVAAVGDGVVRSVPPVDALVVDAADLLPLLATYAVVPASLDDAVGLSDLLDVGLASEEVDGAVMSTGSRTVPVDATVRALVGRDAPVEVHVHDRLICADAAGVATAVPWRLVDGTAHVDAADVAYGMSRALATAVGDWSRRHELHAWLVAAPEARARLDAERAVD